MSAEEIAIVTELFLIYEETQDDPSERARRLADWHAMNDPDPASDHLQ
ncbi:hypothetical protein [Antarcticirhabdus aurantiaca]|uniref:Uncharacterized protein n=2 Tax=Antarcticirhabdus aurantiaca TaxID=2606717 RepID=A0ACD4NQA9_9HYPH|nr:hypothetical protein OXU80_01320 [Jeongeuplla avenae]